MINGLAPLSTRLWINFTFVFDIPVYLAPPATSQGEPVAFVYDVMVLDKYLCKRASLAKEGENLPHGTLLYAALQATEALQKDNADLFGKVEQLKLEKAELIEYAKIICKSFGQSLIDILAIPPPKCMENE